MWTDILEHSSFNCTSEACQFEFISRIPQFIEDSPTDEGDRIVDIFGEYIDWDFQANSRIDPDIFRGMMEKALETADLIELTDDDEDCSAEGLDSSGY